MNRIVVVGAGIAGLLAANRAAEQGAEVVVVNFGVGGLQLGHGCLDVLGYAPDRISDPLARLDGLPAEHPYSILGADAVREGVEYAAQLFGPDLLVGSVDRNHLLPTALGGLRPTCFASPSMLGATGGLPERVVVAGFLQLKDFRPGLVAGNLARFAPETSVRPLILDLPARRGERDSSGLNYARALDGRDHRDRLVGMLAKQVRDGETVVLPGILGLDPGTWREISRALGAPVMEVPLPPPGIPGMRLNRHLLAELGRRGVRVVSGSRVTKLVGQHRVSAVEVATTGHDTTIGCDAVIYAPGGFESGALSVDSHLVISDRLGLPVRLPEGELFTGGRRGDQPLFRSGLAIDRDARVLDANNEPVHDNLFAAGGVLAGALRWREKSGEGIAAASALRAAEGALR